jgi:hypothetical protein
VPEKSASKGSDLIELGTTQKATFKGALAFPGNGRSFSFPLWLDVASSYRHHAFSLPVSVDARARLALVCRGLERAGSIALHHQGSQRGAVPVMPNATD